MSVWAPGDTVVPNDGPIHHGQRGDKREKKEREREGDKREKERKRNGENEAHGGEDKPDQRYDNLIQKVSGPFFIKL